MRICLNAILWLAVSVSAMENVNEAGKNFLGDLAGTFLKALFPEIKQHPHTAADVPAPGKSGTFGPGSDALNRPSSHYTYSGYQGVRPTIPFGNANFARANYFSPPVNKYPAPEPPPPAAGLSVGGLPIFSSLPTHNVFDMGYNGRTDLPSGYVYPFARKGTKVMPDHSNASPFLLAPSNPQAFFGNEQAANLISKHTAEQYGFDWNDASSVKKVTNDQQRYGNQPEQKLRFGTEDGRAFIQDTSYHHPTGTKTRHVQNVAEIITEKPSDEVYDQFNFDYDSLSEFDKSLKLGDLLSSNVSEISPLFIHAFLQAKAENELENYFGQGNAKQPIAIDNDVLPILPEAPSQNKYKIQLPTTEIIPSTTPTTTIASTTTLAVGRENLEHRIDEYLRKTLARDNTDDHDHDRKLPVLHEFIDLRKEAEQPSIVHEHTSHENIIHDPFPRAFRYRILDDPSLSRFMENNAPCSQCISADLNFIKGAWTQIYGDAEALKTTYSNLASLRDVSFVSDKKQLPFSHNLQPINPTCVGLHIKSPSDLFPLNREAEMALFFRDGKREEYHELTGYAKEEQGGSFKFELPHFTMPMCLMKAGPVKNALGDYLIMTDTKGPNKCKSFHVFVNNSKAFARLHAREVIDYLRKRITVSNAHELMSLPHPELCQARAR